MRRLLVYVLVLALSALQIGCSSTQSIAANPDRARAALESGDRVTIHLASGAAPEESVARVDEQGVHARSGSFYPWRDIIRIDKTEISASRTIGAGALTLAALAVVAIALFASSADSLGDE